MSLAKAFEGRSEVSRAEREEAARRYNEGAAKPPVDDTNPKDALGSAKPNTWLVPPVALLLASKVMELGGGKYGPYNFRETAVKYTVYLSAMQRHLSALLDGEDVDRESGMPHEAHIIANCAILLDCMGLGKLIDDRPLPGASAEVLRVLDGFVSSKMDQLVTEKKLKTPPAPGSLPRKPLTVCATGGTPVRIDCSEAQYGLVPKGMAMGG